MTMVWIYYYGSETTTPILMRVSLDHGNSQGFELCLSLFKQSYPVGAFSYSCIVILYSSLVILLLLSGLKFHILHACL